MIKIGQHLDQIMTGKQTYLFHIYFKIITHVDNNYSAQDNIFFVIHIVNPKMTSEHQHQKDVLSNDFS